MFDISTSSVNHKKKSCHLGGSFLSNIQGEYAMLSHAELLYSAQNTQLIMSDLSVKLHGALMGLVPHDYASQLHSGALQPFSLYTTVSEDVVTVHISTLCESADIIIDALCETNELAIYGMPLPITLISYHRESPIPLEYLEGIYSGNHFRLEFLSPAVIKKQGKPFCTMHLGAYFRSVSDKLHTFSNIELDTEKLCAEISSAELTDMHLSIAGHNISGTHYKGFIGHADIRFKTDISQDMSRILAYAQYSGVGAKTALGMGAFRVYSI